MISRTRRNVYIGVIGFCVLGVILTLLFLRPGPSELPADDLLPAGSADSGLGMSEEPADGAVFAPPQVFPRDIRFDLSVFSSSKFAELTEAAILTVGPDELGKDDPFKP